MEVDEDLAQRMQRVREREAELGREKEEVRHFARSELGQIQARIDETKEALEALEIRRDQLCDFLGLQIQEDTSERMAHGALKELCFEALRGSAEGLRSAEVKVWVLRKHPNTKVTSIPATLSRQMEQGILARDTLGRYRIR